MSYSSAAICRDFVGQGLCPCRMLNIHTFAGHANGEVFTMKMTKKEYDQYVGKKAPKSRILLNMVKAFVSGGLICTFGEALVNGYGMFLPKTGAATATSVTLVFIGAMLTGLKVYDNLAKFSGAGTLVPITGFANSVAAPALEFKSEGIITGMSAKMFIIAGPVIVFGISASILYGIVYCIFK